MTTSKRITLVCDDGDEWMTGTLKKHKITERTGPTGEMKKAKIEYQMVNSAVAAWFKLRMKEYGSKGEWVLFKAAPGGKKPAAAKGTAKTAKKPAAVKKAKI